MAQDITSKQANFVQRFAAAAGSLIASVNNLANLKGEWDALGLAQGSPEIDGTNWVLTDAVVQMALPACTATMIDAAVGAVEAIRTTAASQMGYLAPVTK